MYIPSYIDSNYEMCYNKMGCMRDTSGQNHIYKFCQSADFIPSISLLPYKVTSKISLAAHYSTSAIYLLLKLKPISSHPVLSEWRTTLCFFVVLYRMKALKICHLFNSSTHNYQNNRFCSTLSFLGLKERESILGYKKIKL